MTFDCNGVLYYGLISQGSLVNWNVTDPPIEMQAEVIVQNAEKLVWINSVFISEGSIWIATNRSVL